MASQTHHVSQEMEEFKTIFLHSELDDYGLSASEFRVLAHLSRRAQANGKAWPGIDSIASVCKLHKDTVIESLKSLEGYGMLRVDRKPGKGNVYWVTGPSKWKRSEMGNGMPVVGNRERNQSEMGNERISNEGNPKPPSPLKGESGGKSNLPTSKEAIAVAKLFGRRLTTQWSDKEVRAFKKSGILDMEEFELVSRYTRYQRTQEKGIHRKDVLSFLNNYRGEVDRATEWSRKNPRLSQVKAKTQTHIDEEDFQVWLCETYPGNSHIGRKSNEIPSHLGIVKEYLNQL